MNPDSSPSTRLTLASAALIVATFCGVACSSGAANSDAASATGADGAGDGSAGAPVDPNALVGAFVVALKTDVPPSVASMTGQVYDGPTPSMIIWESTATDGSCELFKPRVPFCSTPCGGGAVCVADETCQRQNAIKDVGRVTVAGVKTSSGAAPFDLVDVNAKYTAVPAPIFPPFAEGDDVSVATSSGVYTAFTVHARGIAPLVLSDGALTAERDKPLTLTWTPKGASSDSRIHVKLDISHHGGSKGEISCDADDNGSLTISATLMTQLLNLGVAGFPSIVVTRQTSTASIGPGRIELRIVHDVERAVTVPGLASCTDVTNSTDCAAGKKCQADLTCK
jgi:hypothetical protein